jgi:FkbM family methyltransferase
MTLTFKTTATRRNGAMGDKRQRDILSAEENEQRLVREFLGASPGFFVEVGAFHPFSGSQSWHLEQRGWAGVLVEPQPELAALLTRKRRASVFQFACSAPERHGTEMTLYVAGGTSSLERSKMVAGARATDAISVRVRTLDDILLEAEAPPQVDLMSLDVEGHEIEVLRGFDLARWKPRLILLEDHIDNLSKHRFMTSKGYVLVRRTGLNNWYVPRGSTVRLGAGDAWSVFRKLYLSLPFRIARNFSRRLRQPVKDWMHQRRDV